MTSAARERRTWLGLGLGLGLGFDRVAHHDDLVLSAGGGEDAHDVGGGEGIEQRAEVDLAELGVGVGVGVGVG